MVSSTSRATTAKWCSPRALDADRRSSGSRYVARTRSRSASIAARSISVTGPSDPEEDVQEAVGDRPVSSDRARVAPSERREHEATGVELENGQSLGVARDVREPVL